MSLLEIAKLAGNFGVAGIAIIALAYVSVMLINKFKNGASNKVSNDQILAKLDLMHAELKEIRKMQDVNQETTEKMRDKICEKIEELARELYRLTTAVTEVVSLYRNRRD